MIISNFAAVVECLSAAAYISYLGFADRKGYSQHCRLVTGANCFDTSDTDQYVLLCVHTLALFLEIC